MRLIETLQGQKTEQTPFWFMRQAGRYLPEYKQLRATANGFLDLCYSPEKAAEVTLQPLRRFDMDAAILFSDILVLPHALGANVFFVEGEGPKVTPIRDMESVDMLDLARIESHCTPVYETVTRVQQALAKDKALIGFCGAPWTVACYMVEGGGSKEFAITRQAMMRREPWFDALIRKLVDGSVDYLLGQIAAGAHVVQIFDSWAGLLTPEDFAGYSIAPIREIVARVKAEAPQVPVIGFAKGAGINLPKFAAETGVDAVGIDYTMDPAWAAENVPSHVALQGNLDPCLLAADGARAVIQTHKILEAWKKRPHIFNLGHGILPNTPIAHVEMVSDAVKAFR